MSRIRLPVRLPLLATALAGVLATLAAPAAAVDCPVNVLEAYNKAKLRGWGFTCELRHVTQAGISYAFVTYPPSAIGCTFKTPAVLGLNKGIGGQARFFSSATAPGARPELRNGWKVKTFEISGGQWSNSYAAAFDPRARVVWSTDEKPKPNRTYNFKLEKLVLTHPSSTCAKAIDQAF